MKLKRWMAAGLSLAMAISLLPASVFAADTDEQPTEGNDGATYVWMNIPYDDFYKAELGEYNEVEVDGFTSATYNKTRTKSLANGSYHTKSDGSSIDGVTFPVKLDENELSALENSEDCTKVTDESSVTITVTNRGQTSTTTYTGKDALFESGDYSYYVIDTETDSIPSYYKELTIEDDGEFSFGAVEGIEPIEVSDVDGKIEFLTKSSYGDYQLNLKTDLFGDAEIANAAIYGVVIETVNEENKTEKYGLRHMENIWRGTDLSWCTGFTADVHGCPTSSKHYESMMGNTITSVVYYTDQGVYRINTGTDGIYVPTKYDATFEVADAYIEDEETLIRVVGDIPFENPGYTITPDYGFEVTTTSNENEYKLTWDADQCTKGTYTLTVSDPTGIYADSETEFILKTDVMPVQYDSSKKALIPAAGADSYDVESYVANITKVSVNGTSYNASGHGAVQIINEDGTINKEAAPIVNPETYELVVSATGYDDYSFTYTVEKEGSSVNTEDKTPTNQTPTNQTPTSETPASQTPTSQTPAAQSTTTQTATTTKVKVAKVTGLKKKSVKKSSAVITWKKIKGVSGYQVVRATKKKGNYKTVKTVKKAGTVKFKNTKLKRKTTYYYKVRAYKVVNGVKVYGSYSKILKLKTK